MSPEEEVTLAEEAPPYNKLTEDEKPYALFTDGSCRIVGKHRRWKAAVWSPTRRVAEAAEGQGESSQFAEVKAIQLALDIAEREKWPTLYLYTDSWMVANALWGWLQQWKRNNWQRRGKPIWAAPLWQHIAARLEKLVVKVRHVDAHVPKSRATEEHQNNQRVDQAAKIEVAQVDLDWQRKGELFIARWARDTSGHQGGDATYRWARDRGVDLSMDAISQVIHQCETCAAIKQAKRVLTVEFLKEEEGKTIQGNKVDSLRKTFSTSELSNRNKQDGSPGRSKEMRVSLPPQMPNENETVMNESWKAGGSDGNDLSLSERVKVDKFSGLEDTDTDEETCSAGSLVLPGEAEEAVTYCTPFFDKPIQLKFRTLSVPQPSDSKAQEEDWVREHLGKLDTHKSMGPNRIRPQVLRELADVIARPLSIIFERSWKTGEVLEDWRKANVTLVFKKGKEEDPGNYRPVSLTSIPGKMMEQLILIGGGQHGFTKGKSCLTNLIAFYDGMTG
ncbi:hypothetical protein GRJ2_001482100 [Grus japonensis]|uniref:RNase H type-1 domain-containing protein n=1 Tax=Grus japonensis TaxID=30415 RepID=A0ABC9WXL4_GRUJA